MQDMGQAGMIAPTASRRLARLAPKRLPKAIRGVCEASAEVLVMEDN